MFAGFAVSCEKVIEFKGEALNPKIVVYSLLNPDSLITAGISVSHPVFDAEYSYRQITNAEVSLYEDGAFVENLEYVPSFSFSGISRSLSLYASPSRRPVPGRLYRLEVSLAGYDPVSCEASFPTSVPILSVDTTTEVHNEYGLESYSWLAKIRFSDPAEEENYYRLILKRSSGFYGGDKLLPYSPEIPVYVYTEPNSWIDTEDPLLVPTEENSLFGSDVPNTFSIFSDELISGKEHELIINIYQSYQAIDTSYHEFLHITVELQSISRDLYRYLQTFAAHSMLEGNFISEPVMVYSNVQNGLGAFGAYLPSRFNISKGRYPEDGVYYIVNPGYYY